jgi:hypothetical protein
VRTTRPSRPISSLAEHPNAAEVRAVLARIPEMTDTQLEHLAGSWHDTPELATARDRALSADSPLVLDVLAAFEAVDDLFADDLAGRPWAAPLPRTRVRLALKAVRDALAAAYAQPVLTRHQHARLMAPWREIFPAPGDGRLDLGPNTADIRRLLGELDRLAQRCHDAAAADDWSRAVEATRVKDDAIFESARRDIWAAAQLSGRRRTRVAVRRMVTDALTSPCPTCAARPAPTDRDLERVGSLWLDAMWALLVADAVDETMVDILVLPVNHHLDVDRA